MEDKLLMWRFKCGSKEAVQPVCEKYVVLSDAGGRTPVTSAPQKTIHSQILHCEFLKESPAHSRGAFCVLSRGEAKIVQYGEFI